MCLINIWINWKPFINNAPQPLIYPLPVREGISSIAMADTHDLDYESRLAEGPAKLFKIFLAPLTLNILSDRRLSPPEDNSKKAGYHQIHEQYTGS
jgi:hypothetical protein